MDKQVICKIKGRFVHEKNKELCVAVHSFGVDFTMLDRTDFSEKWKSPYYGS